MKMQQPVLRGVIIDNAAIASIQRDKTQMPKTHNKYPFRQVKYTETKATKPGNGSTCSKCGKVILKISCVLRVRQCVTSARREDIYKSCVKLLLRLLESRKRQLMHFLEHSQTAN